MLLGVGLLLCGQSSMAVVAKTLKHFYFTVIPCVHGAVALSAYRISDLRFTGRGFESWPSTAA